MKLMDIIPKGITRKTGRSILVTKKNSPHIFFGLGLAGTLAGTVLACRATLKLDKTLDEIKRDKDDILELRSEGGSQQEYVRDLGYIYTKGMIKLGRLYGPAIVIGGAGIASLTGSHVQMTKRNTALTVTLAAVTKAYDEYRLRIAEAFGEERELDLHRGLHDEKHQLEGKKEVVKVIDPNGFSPYTRLFEESNPNWKPNAEMNRVFLMAHQHYFNHRLLAYGHVFLNEVYDALGLERSQAGAVVGWVSNSEGDGFIDFGLFEAYNTDFVNGFERNIWLDFNVDGIIYNLI